MQSVDVDKALVACIGLCLLAFLGACFCPWIGQEVRGEISDVMKWFGLALGIGGAGVVLRKTG